MAAAAKAVATKPFVGASAPRRAFTPDAFLAPTPAGAAKGGDKGGSGEPQGESKAAAASTKPWRAGGPPKKVRLSGGRQDLCLGVQAGSAPPCGSQPSHTPSARARWAHAPLRGRRAPRSAPSRRSAATSCPAPCPRPRCAAGPPAAQWPAPFAAHALGSSDGRLPGVVQPACNPQHGAHRPSTRPPLSVPQGQRRREALQARGLLPPAAVHAHGQPVRDRGAPRAQRRLHSVCDALRWGRGCWPAARPRPRCACTPPRPAPPAARGLVGAWTV